MTIPSDCPFSSGRGYYTRCSNDAFGTLCSCCYMSSFQGMASASGTCVPADSPIVQVKGSLNGKYGLQSMFSLFLLAVLTLMLIFWFNYPLNVNFYFTKKLMSHKYV